MSPALANFLFEAANFLLLAAALGWVLFKPVRRALDAERARHAQQEEEIGRLHAEAQALTEKARAAQRAAARDADEHRQAVLDAAKKEASALLDEARKARRAERHALQQELQARRKAEAAALAEVVGHLATNAVRKLLEQISGPSLDVALVKAACEKIAAFPAEARRSAFVESARALSAESKALLQGALGGGFDERVVDKLGAGVRVTTPAGQVDATAESLARYAGRAVSELSTEPAEPRDTEPRDTGAQGAEERRG